METISNKKRIKDMDNLRAISVIAVIIIHVSAFSLTASTEGGRVYYISLILNQLTRFSVPLFVLISGIGLGLSYKRKGNFLKDYIKFIVHRLGKVIPLYVLWCVIYLTVINNDFQYSTWINKILTGDKIIYHLYYMPMIIKLYFIFPLLYTLMKKKIGVFMGFLITAGIYVSAHYYDVPNLHIDFFGKRNVLFWIFYFILGVYISEKIPSIINGINKHKKIISIITMLSSLLIIVESYFALKENYSLDYATTFIRPSIIIYSLVVSCFFVNFQIKNKNLLKFFKKISNNSYVIYLSHPMVLYYYIKLLKNMKISIGNEFFIVTSILVSIIIANIFGNITSIFKKNKKEKKGIHLPI